MNEREKKPAMDPAIWSNIPDEVIARIVSFLPVPVKVRFSVVCKLWNSVIFSSDSGETPSIVFQCLNKGDGRCDRYPLDSLCFAIYDIPDKRWYSINVDFIPPPPQTSILFYAIISASGGLLCIWPKARFYEGFIVCNPVSKYWADLPSRGDDKADFVVMHVDNDKRYYKVLVVTTTHGDDTTELYDSRSRKWSRKQNNPYSRKGFRPVFGCLGGSNAYLLYKFVTRERDPCLTIEVYDMEQEKWKPSLPGPAERFEVLNLLDCNGRLMLIGRFSKRPLKDEIVIWEFTASVDGLNSWREAERMPEDANEFLGISVFKCSRISRGDQIFFIGAFYTTIVVYDVLKRTWGKLAANLPKSMGERPDIGFDMGFTFDLCLHRF